MATATWLIVGSVDKAVTAGSHDGASPNRRRRSSIESFWMSMNSGRHQQADSEQNSPNTYSHSLSLRDRG